MPNSTNLPLPLARRAALILAAAGALAGAGGPIAIGASGLIGLLLLPAGQKAFATLPVTAFVVGTALASMPAALLMQRVGRRNGFLVGLALGTVASLGASAAIAAQSFAAFVIMMAGLGAAGAFIQQYRFAAADAAEPAFKPRAIAWVMAAGVVSGIIGPQVSINAGWLIPPAGAAAPFVVLAVLYLVAALIMTRLVVPAPAPVKTSSRGRPLGRIVFQPPFLVALVSAVASFSLMILVMTAAPIAMVGHQHSMADSQLAIQWHVIAMFGPSFFTGGLIARFGRGTIATIGFALIGVAALVGLSGTGLWQFGLALILLGAGWNFAYIAATAMLATLYRPEESFMVQAVNELIVSGVVAIASFSSGGLLAGSGWATINLIVLPVIVACMVLIGWRALIERRARASM